MTFQYIHEPIVNTDGLGKKAGNLRLLSLAGFSVPKGFVIPGSADLYREDLARAVEAIGGFPVAVRSSGAAEDLKDASFAGLYETFLNVTTPEELVEKALACRDSGHSERVRTYLAHAGLPADAGRDICVFVQRMVKPRYAGVGFSIDPVSGKEEHCLVEVCHGLGERLVSGHASPTRLVLDARTGGILERDAGGENVELPTAHARELSRVLTDIQAHFGSPQDVEWAIDDEGALWVLQARPVTTIRWRKDLGEYSTANMKEGGVSSAVCYPLVYSVIASLFQKTMIEFLSALKLTRADNPVELMRLHYGRAYWHVGAVKAILQNLPGFDEKAFDDDLGIQKDYGDAGPRTTGFNPWTVLSALPVALSQSRLFSRQLKQAEEVLGSYEQEHKAWEDSSHGFASLSDGEFNELFLRMYAEFFVPVESAYLHTGFNNAGAQTEFSSLMRKLSEKTEQIFSNVSLMGGLTGVGHMETQKALRQLCVTARGSGQSSAAFSKHLNDFLEIHGYHGERELDISVPRWCEAPDQLRRLITGMLATDHLGPDPEETSQKQREAFQKEMRRVLSTLDGSLWLRLRFKGGFVSRLKRLREYLQKKEQMRELSSRSYFILRKFVLEMGRRLADNKVIGAPEDIFFVEMSEVQALAREETIEDIQELIEHRRRSYLGYRNFTPPDEIGGALIAEKKRTAQASDSAFSGVGCSEGIVEGVVRVLQSPGEINTLADSEILVTRFTDPSWTPLFGLVSGVITEMGGVLSHAAVISREYGIPAVLNVDGATELLKTGQRVRVDGLSGTVEVLS